MIKISIQEVIIFVNICVPNIGAPKYTRQLLTGIKGKMVQMSRFAVQMLRHRCREWTYGQQGGKTAVGWGWWCAELGDWD